MIFQVSLDDLKGRLSSLKRFNTLQEKNALLVEDNESIQKLLLELTPAVISSVEADVFLLKLREISVSDTIDMIITCPKCGFLNNEVIPISNFIQLDEPMIFEDSKANKTTLPVGIYSGPEDILSPAEFELLTLKDYTKLENLIKEQNENIIQDVTARCRNRECRTEMAVGINARDNFTKSTLSSIYQDYVDISTFSNNSKLDIDSLYPFEREIFVNLIKDKIKED